MEKPKLTIAIDWGTHSSKWWYTLEGKSRKKAPTPVPRVIDSTVHRQGEALLVNRERTLVRSDVQDSRLKRLLLVDPMGADYWEAVRQGIGVSLGEAATLVIACMLSDVFSNFLQTGENLDDLAVHIHYSLPNWTEADPQHNVARQRMYQTATVVSALIGESGWRSLPQLGTPVLISGWRKVVQDSLRRVVGEFRDCPPTFAEMMQAEYECGGIHWRLAAESSAAGFLPLAHLLSDVRPESKAAQHWVKLLVVDVGAGSTDSGYFVSSRRIKDQYLVFNYLPPALTLDYAGEQLTEMLRDHLRRTRRRDITQAEAETIKLSAPEDWIGEPFVEEWRSKIARCVGEYILMVPDERRLPDTRMPALKVVLTGGSGVVRGLDQSIRSAVCGALVHRGIQSAYANRTEVVPLRSPISDRVDAARRAVSTGAAQPDFALLAYMPRFEKFEPHAVGPANTWV